MMVKLSAQSGIMFEVPAHSSVREVRLPKLEGMVPLSWLLPISLRAGVVALSIQQGRTASDEGGAHSAVSAVRLPRHEGMVPISWLLARTLQSRYSASAQEYGTVQEARTESAALSGCKDWLELCRLAQRGRFWCA